MTPSWRRWDAIVLIALVAAGCAVTIAWGERLGVHQGEGWDGQMYAIWARGFPESLRFGHLTDYQAQRVLPSGLVYYALEALHVDHTRTTTILGFQILDGCALVATAVFLLRIAAALGWSRATLWAAAAGTFLGFANARHALYYPTLTDPSAFALAMAATWAYVTRRPIAQWVIAAASALTWPALLGPGLVALVLPRAAEPPPPATGPWPRRAAIAVGIAAAVVLTAWLVEELVNPYESTERWLEMSHRSLWPLTIACIVIPGAVAAYIVAREPRTWSIRAYLVAVGWRRIAAGIAAAVAIVVARDLWVARIGNDPGMDVRAMQHLYAALAVRGPLWDIVHHVVYFGPIVLVALLAWRRIAAVAAAWGPGAVLGLGIAVVSAVTTESRQLAHVVPLVIVLTIAATAEQWTRTRAIAFAAIGVVWSKLWWPIHYEQIHDTYGWPDLRYTMQQGPWASDLTFAIHLAAAVVTALALARWVTGRAPDRTSPDSP